jgi:hypothetical protein
VKIVGNGELLGCECYLLVSPAVDSLDVPPPTPSAPYAVVKNALSIPRTTSQVLNIVYAGGSRRRDSLNG